MGKLENKYIAIQLLKGAKKHLEYYCDDDMFDSNDINELLNIAFTSLSLAVKYLGREIDKDEEKLK